MITQPSQTPLYQTSYLFYYIKVFSDHVEFRNSRGVQTVPLTQIATITVGTPLLFQITIQTYDGQEYRIPTRKKREAHDAIRRAQADYAAAHVSPPHQPVASMPIDAEIERVKLEIQHVGLQLRQVNTAMANERAHFQQNHNYFRGTQRSSKDDKLSRQQPVKERLQQEKLALEQELNQLRILKAQGTTHITH